MIVEKFAVMSSVLDERGRRLCAASESQSIWCARRADGVVAGGDCVDDLRVLDADEGFCRVLQRTEWRGLPRRQRRRGCVRCAVAYSAHLLVFRAKKKVLESLIPELLATDLAVAERYSHVHPWIQI